MLLGQAHACDNRTSFAAAHPTRRVERHVANASRSEGIYAAIAVKIAQRRLIGSACEWPVARCRYSRSLTFASRPV